MGSTGDYLVWTPSLGTPCGIAEYATHLTSAAAALGHPARAVSGLDGMARPRTVHVQHEFALYDDYQLERAIADIHNAGAAVVVTEHSVIEQAWAPADIHEGWHTDFLRPAKGWESQTDCLVALSQCGAATLASRWPTKRVEHLIHGCPTWFPPRKRTRGRVLGVFGFLAPYKGVESVVNFLRADRQSQLLLISHPRDDGYQRRIEVALEGLPVRWIKEFGSEEEAAVLLAKEADVLVYWYDESNYQSTSGAVLTGLASGVPVITSASGMFADVQSVTLQVTDLSAGINELLDHDELRRDLAESAREYCTVNSWARTAARHVNLWDSVYAQVRDAARS